MASWIKKVYLYVVSLISLVIIVVGSIMLINLALKTWVFTKADNNYYPEYQCPQPAPASDKSIAPVPCNDEEQARLSKQERDNRVSQKQRDAAQAIAMILVASPVFFYHWKLARKET